jgi:hypothetical protein
MTWELTLSYCNSSDYRGSKRYKHDGISDGDGKSPNDLSDLISEQLRRLSIAVDILEEHDLMKVFRRRLGLL